MRQVIQLLLLLLLIIGARPQVQGQQDLSSRSRRQLQEMVEFNEVFEQAHTGFVLYDLDYQVNLYDYNADRRFVPASNVKLLTFYLAHRLLGHRAPGLLYQDYGDHLEIWGTGYPLLLHPQFVGYDEVGPWLNAEARPVTLHFPTDPGQQLPRYGAGWSWDDYNDGYVYERSALPVYGNRLYLELSPRDSLGRQVLLGAPPTVAGSLREQLGQEARIHRPEFGNQFTVRPGFTVREGSPVQRPLHLSVPLLVNELAAVYPQRTFTAGQAPYPALGPGLNRLDVSLPDTVYRRVLRNSDNYLAEQLLVQAAVAKFGQPDVKAIIAYAKDSLLLPLGIDRIRWVDGSGLSRYNLMTPRHLARLVMALDQEIGRQRLLNLLAVGGESGTLARRLAGKNGPYVYAKTGSLSGVTCLSGLLLTRRGKWLAFSFMHNNYVGGSAAYYQEMERVLEWVWERL